MKPMKSAGKPSSKEDTTGISPKWLRGLSFGRYFAEQITKNGVTQDPL